MAGPSGRVRIPRVICIYVRKLPYIRRKLILPLYYDTNICHWQNHDYKHLPSAESRAKTALQGDLNFARPMVQQNGADSKKVWLPLKQRKRERESEREIDRCVYIYICIPQELKKH